ncbi:MAG: ROK family protein [Candidatus Brocadiales bacterium]
MGKTHKSKPRSKSQRGKLVLATDLGGTNLRTALVNDRGEILAHIRRPTKANIGKDKLIDKLITMLKATASKHNTPLKRINGICIGFAGPVDAELGVVLTSPHMNDWVNVPLKDIMEEEFKIPVIIENDANAAALGEHWMGAGKGAKSLVCITLGTGIGGGIVLNDKIWHGATGFGAEIGHTTIIRNGFKCKCGNRGCLEAYASATGMVRLMHKALARKSAMQNDGVDEERFNKDGSKYINELAAKGNKNALWVIKEMTQILGIAIVNIAHTLNPEVIIIGGGVANMGSKLFEPLRKEVKKRAFEKAVEYLRIVPAKLGDNAGIIGAARSALNRL